MIKQIVFPPQIAYGASSSVFSRKQNFPDFLRTVHPNKDVVEAVTAILQEFDWRWVAFLHSDDDYDIDGRDLFIKKIDGTDTCLAYSKGLNSDTNYTQMFSQLETNKINVFIVFAPEWTVEDLIEAAIRENITKKVWVAVDAWSLNKQLPKKDGIRNIGTVIGLAEPVLTTSGFHDFIYSFKAQSYYENAEEGHFFPSELQLHQSDC